MIIKILGVGCAKCKQLAANAQQASKELGIDVTIEKIVKPEDIMEYGVIKTPALVVDEKVVTMGKVASAEEIKKYLL